MSTSNINVMVLWHAAPVPFAPPKLHPQQWTGYLTEHASLLDPQQDPRGFLIPRGEFDLAEVLNQQSIPLPDWLFVCVDATTPFFARNLENAAKRRLLCLGDTHHLPTPLTRLLPYAGAEPWDGLIFTNNVRHAHWFSQVTGAPQFFEPAIFALELDSNPTHSEDLKQPVFYGQMGTFHPRRQRLMSPLLEQGMVHHIFGSTHELAAQMSQSAACVNVTLNSDLNSRVFEIAQTGCLQLIDKLGIHNGMGSVLIPGHNCLAFNDSDELRELVLDLPLLKSLTPLLGNNLRQEWRSHWGIHAIRERLAQGIQSDTMQFLKAPKSIRDQTSHTTPALNWRLHVYENFLELHRQNEQMDILIESAHRECYAQDLDDLPRMHVVDRDTILKPSSTPKFFIRDKENGEPELLAINSPD